MKTFAQKLDFRVTTAGEMIKDHGEDNFYSVMGENCAVAAVFDGCGGIGSRKYPNFRNHTGAYMASRAASGALHDWYHETGGAANARAADTAAQIKDYICRSLRVVGKYSGPTSRIFGTMVRDFPSTAAVAVVQNTGDGTMLQCFWAGDSRVYLLDHNGLSQLTRDDLEGTNAMSNLQSDGALTNVISLDRDFEIHYSRPLLFREQDAYSVFASSDGCFGYLPTPMDFEYMLLSTLEESGSPAAFEQNLDGTIRSIAGDDYTLSWMSFGYGSFPNMKAALKKRTDFMRANYIEPLTRDSSEDLQLRLWNVYRGAYERFLPGTEAAAAAGTAAAQQRPAGR